MHDPSPAELTATPSHGIGVVTPSGNTVVERVSIAILRSHPGVSVHFSRIPVHGDRDPFPDDYDWESMMRASHLLAHAKPGVLCWNGSKGGSIGFEFDRRLCARIESETGCPATTSSIALVEALRAAGATRIGLVSPFEAGYQNKVMNTFAREGYPCVGEAHAGLTDNLSFASVPGTDVIRMARAVAAHKPDVILTWCTNFLAAPFAAQIERETGIPCYDSTALAIWHPLKMLGVDTKPAAAWGSLFSGETPKRAAA